MNGSNEDRKKVARIISQVEDVQLFRVIPLSILVNVRTIGYAKERS